MPEETIVPVQHKIVEGLLALAVPIDSIFQDQANPRLHAERNIESIKASLQQFGQRQPLVVQKQGMIIRAGNGRHRAAKALGWTHVAALVVDETNVTATAFAIADNRTAELAEWDDEALANALRALDEDGFDLELTGFMESELEALLGEPVADPNSEWRGMPEYSQEDNSAAFRCIVNFRNAEDLQAFEKLIGQRARKTIWYPADPPLPLHEQNYTDQEQEPEQPTPPEA